MNDLNIIQAELLLFGHNVKNKADRDRYHNHSCWQIELPHCGSMKALFDHEALTVSSGELLIIPPGFWHFFEYNSQNFATWSLKFKLSGLASNLPIRLLPAEPIFIQAGNFIETALKEIQSKSYLEEPQVPPSDFNKIIFIESLIVALITYVYLDKKKDNFILANKIRSIIKARNGKALTVKEASKILGYSQSHLSLLFKQNYGVSLKTFIDQERAEIAKSFLEYTEMNITETAITMGFKDVYYFSHFFKRLTSVSPLKYKYKKGNIKLGNKF